MAAMGTQARQKRSLQRWEMFSEFGVRDTPGSNLQFRSILIFYYRSQHPLCHIFIVFRLCNPGNDP